MRTIVLLPLTALVVVVVGCGSEARKPAVRSLPQRDLTLVTQTAHVDIASPVEMQRARIPRATVRHSRWAARPAVSVRSKPVAPKIVLASVAAPALPVPEPVAQPAGAASTPDNGRELLPGKTVTLIPASSGPSPGSGTADESLPPEGGRTIVARGGGTCRGRGRGPGITAAPRPDFR